MKFPVRGGSIGEEYQVVINGRGKSALWAVGKDITYNVDKRERGSISSPPLY